MYLNGYKYSMTIISHLLLQRLFKSINILVIVYKNMSLNCWYLITSNSRHTLSFNKKYIRYLLSEILSIVESRMNARVARGSDGLSSWTLPYPLKCYRVELRSESVRPHFVRTRRNQWRAGIRPVQVVFSDCARSAQVMRKEIAMFTLIRADFYFNIEIWCSFRFIFLLSVDVKL